MILTCKSLLYDISNMAFVIADTGASAEHALHTVRDICQEGNIDRVARILGLAYSRLLAVMFPILRPPSKDFGSDFSVRPRDYRFSFQNDCSANFSISKVMKFKIMETVREYMVCMVLADWLAVALPQSAEVWKLRAGRCMQTISELVAETVSASSLSGFRRKISPF